MPDDIVEPLLWVEPGLHVPVAVATGVAARGRWRLEFTGTGAASSHDPVLTFAMTTLAADKQARLAGARATVVRIDATPAGATPAALVLVRDPAAADALAQELAGR